MEETEEEAEEASPDEAAPDEDFPLEELEAVVEEPEPELWVAEETGLLLLQEATPNAEKARSNTNY